MDREDIVSKKYSASAFCRGAAPYASQKVVVEEAQMSDTDTTQRRPHVLEGSEKTICAVIHTGAINKNGSKHFKNSS